MIEINRETRETNIKCKLEVNGEGKSTIKTGVGFFDHMLEAFSKHSGINLELSCDGDLHVDAHHTVEDCGIVIGQALKKEIFPIEAVERYGNATVVMDEAAVTCRIFRFQIKFKATYTGIIQFVFLFNFSLFSCSEIILAHFDKVIIGVQVKSYSSTSIPK